METHLGVGRAPHIHILVLCGGNGRLHATADTPTEKGVLVPISDEVCWGPGPGGALRKGAKSFAPVGNKSMMPW
jgi:hypothetical protein